MAGMKRFEIITEAEARVLPRGEAVELETLRKRALFAIDYASMLSFMVHDFKNQRFDPLQEQQNRCFRRTECGNLLFYCLES